MMQWLIIVALIFFMFFSWFVVRASKGVRRNLEQLEFCIQELLDRGFENGLLIVTHEKSKCFLQFRKYIAKGEIGIELSFPKAQWSEPYFDVVASHCKSNNLDLIIENGSNGMVFADINFGKEIQEAYSLCRYIFTEVFKIDRLDCFLVKLENASAK